MYSSTTKTKAKANLLSPLMIMRSLKFVQFQKSHKVSLFSFFYFLFLTVYLYFYSILLDLRGQKHQVELTVKMGLEAKNYESVSILISFLF